MIYRIGADCHIVGSLHVRPANATLPDIYWKLQRDAETVTFETSLDPLDVDLDKIGSLDARTTLSQVLPPELYAAVSALWKDLGLTSRLGRLRPWAVASALDHFLIRREGLSEDCGVDRLLWEATALEKRRWLESAMDQLAPLIDSPKQEVLHALRIETLTPLDWCERVWEIQEAWRTGDADALSKVHARTAREQPVDSPLVSANHNPRSPDRFAA